MIFKELYLRNYRTELNNFCIFGKPYARGWKKFVAISRSEYCKHSKNRLIYLTIKFWGRIAFWFCFRKIEPKSWLWDRLDDFTSVWSTWNARYCTLFRSARAGLSKNETIIEIGPIFSEIHLFKNPDNPQITKIKILKIRILKIENLIFEKNRFQNGWGCCCGFCQLYVRPRGSLGVCNRPGTAKSRFRYPDFPKKRRSYHVPKEKCKI